MYLDLNLLSKGFLQKKLYALARILRGRYFDPHSPRKRADFGVQLGVFGMGGHISGPEMGHFLGASWYDVGRPRIYNF